MNRRWRSLGWSDSTVLQNSIALYIIGVILLFSLIAWTFPSPKPMHPETAVVPPPTHIVWKDYPVGGLLLVNPMQVDSLGVPEHLVIPEGSVLLVPHRTEGAPPDSVAS